MYRVAPFIVTTRSSGAMLRCNIAVTRYQKRGFMSAGRSFHGGVISGPPVSAPPRPEPRQAPHQAPHQAQSQDGGTRPAGHEVSGLPDENRPSAPVAGG